MASSRATHTGMLGFTTPAIGPTPPASWLVMSGIWPSSTSAIASAGVSATPSSHSALPSAARIGGHMRCGLDRRAGVRDTARGVVGGDLGGRYDVDDHRPRSGQSSHRIRLCMQRCVHGPRSYGRRRATETDRRSQPRAATLDRLSEGSAPARPYARPVGLYDPAYEHDGCGVACLARLDGRPAHETITRAIETLDNLEHRGAEGADAETGDGAGILTQIPDAFLRAELDFELPPAGRYAVAVCMLPREDDRRAAAETVIERLVEDGGQRVLGWRDVPVDERVPGPGARPTMPVIRQLLIGAGEGDFERAPVRDPAPGRARASATRSRSRASPRARWS